MSQETCPECGATLRPGGSCRDHFHALLLLEGEIPGVAGAIAHFYAVACYALQHPESMGFTREALDGLRSSLADALDGRARVAGLRERARAGAARAGRVTRRTEDPVPAWPGVHWTRTVADVCTAETFGEIDTAEAYHVRVTAWARSVREALDTAGL